MIEVRQTTEFEMWVRGLSDKRVQQSVARRVARLQSGLFGDAKFFDGIGELRIDMGPGYRVYFVQKGQILVILLCGGEKGTQKRDIRRAKLMAEEV